MSCLSGCRGIDRLCSLETSLRWTEEYSLPTEMRPYPTVKIYAETLRTILVKANKGVGKSKAGATYLVEMLERNPSASCVVIAANVALADKHLEELHQAGLTDFVLYSNIEGNIEDERVMHQLCAPTELP
jgi:hypothetical protein